MEFLDKQKFYNLMQTYRHAQIQNQGDVAKAFEAVKTYIREEISKLKEDS